MSDKGFGFRYTHRNVEREEALYCTHVCILEALLMQWFRMTRGTNSMQKESNAWFWILREYEGLYVNVFGNEQINYKR